MTLDAPFTVSTGPEPDGHRLVLAGRVDRDAEEPLLAAFGDVVRDGAVRVVLDLHAATYINSSGLAAIVALLTEAGRTGVAVAARGLTSHYRHLFEITRLTDLIEVEPRPAPGGVA